MKRIIITGVAAMGLALSAAAFAQSTQNTYGGTVSAPAQNTYGGTASAPAQNSYGGTASAPQK